MSIGHHDEAQYFSQEGLTLACIDCGIKKPISEFPSRQNDKYRAHGHRTRCWDCTRAKEHRRYVRERTENYFHFKTVRARSRAQHLKVPFDLDEEYLESIWTDDCPVLSIPLEKHVDRKSEQAVELDRKIPELGYIKGNVVFMSRKANRLKNNASKEDLRRLLSWMDSNV